MISAPALSLLSCSEKVDGGYVLVNGEKVVPEYVMQIGDKKVSFDEYRYYYLYSRDNNDQGDRTYWDGDGSKAADLLSYVENNIVSQYVMQIMADELKITLDETDNKDITDNYASAVEYYGGEDAFNKKLAENYLTPELYNDLSKTSALTYKAYQYYYGDNGTMKFTDEEYADYFEKNYYAAYNILFLYAEGEDATNCPETIKKINEISERIKNGEDFITLSTTVGDDIEGMKANPNGYHFTEGDMVGEFYNTVKSLEINGISEPFTTSYGCHIVMRVPLNADTRESMKEKVLYGYTDSYNNWVSGYYETLYQELVNDKKESITVKYSDIYDKISPTTVY
ncbi:Foldase protein PrsA [bioreactor metagenome]|uniref:Foldase protein PrsA n=1 Tax=bioreactor metagenome TaxID=1076179 RepID=A0A645C0S6_9ZZZZ